MGIITDRLICPPLEKGVPSRHVLDQNNFTNPYDARFTVTSRNRGLFYLLDRLRGLTILERC
jgi:hypothetical protein